MPISLAADLDQTAAQSIGQDINILNARTIREIDAGFATLRQMRADAGWEPCVRASKWPRGEIEKSSNAPMLRTREPMRGCARLGKNQPRLSAAIFIDERELPVCLWGLPLA